MNTKHTSGPWDYDRSPQDYDGGGSPAYCTVTARGGEIIIAEVNDKIAEGVANSRLIAAAPELLESVIYQLDLNKWIESADAESPFFEETLRLRLNTASDYMTAAIAKATGEAAP